MTTPDTAVQALSDERKAFEFWYSTNAFDYVRNPIGCRDCAMQWDAWKAAVDRAFRAPPADDPRSVIEACFAIQVEKLLLAKLGRNWTPAGISIESLVDELAARGAAVAPINQPEAERERLQELLGEAACTLSMYFNSVPLDDEMKDHAIDVWKRCIDA